MLPTVRDRQSRRRRKRGHGVYVKRRARSKLLKPDETNHIAHFIHVAIFYLRGGAARPVGTTDGRGGGLSVRPARDYAFRLFRANDRVRSVSGWIRRHALGARRATRCLRPPAPSTIVRVFNVNVTNIIHVVCVCAPQQYPADVGINLFYQTMSEFFIFAFFSSSRCKRSHLLLRLRT